MESEYKRVTFTFIPEVLKVAGIDVCHFTCPGFIDGGIGYPPRCVCNLHVYDNNSSYHFIKPGPKCTANPDRKEKEVNSVGKRVLR